MAMTGITIKHMAIQKIVRGTSRICIIAIRSYSSRAIRPRACLIQAAMTSQCPIEKRRRGRFPGTSRTGRDLPPARRDYTNCARRCATASCTTCNRCDKKSRADIHAHRPIGSYRIHGILARSIWFLWYTGD